MKICHDDQIGYYGEIVNCINMVDLSTKNRYKLDSNRQLETIKSTILNYNGNAEDYENIVQFSVDAGAGGGGVSAYSDPLLKDWYDSSGKLHKGFLDGTYELYNGYEMQYPNASNKIKLLNPRKLKKDMTEQLIELMNSGLIKFPREYSRQGYITLTRPSKDSNEEEVYDYELSWEEECALVNIDALKTEITSIYRFDNSENTTVTYALPQDKEGRIHDDRFYTLIMLAHYLYTIRRGDFTDFNTAETDLTNFVKYANQSNSSYIKSQHLISKIFR
jgi:hypothetical protein